VVRSFLFSPEQIGAVADAYYETFLGRASDAGGRASFVREVAAGRQTFDSYLVIFLTSEEYVGHTQGRN
jgi:hypothetical protein